MSGQRLIQLFDPVRKRTMQLSELGYSVAYMLDGRDLVCVAEAISRDLHVDLSIPTLLRFAERLAELGCLEPVPVPARAKPARDRGEVDASTVHMAGSQVARLLRAASVRPGISHRGFRRRATTDSTTFDQEMSGVVTEVS